ncbi:bifunctional diaminohydroxyphosphoribosylaminopyrimidine deaminase/5-amino-6-(5-phosphoribosylamino)uracil reductase RibD [Candidatus Acetothermia bacterium]|nr:bifunctional diaminohydroxyphosphoribosylaminopyrimidine deaminase/5-amino-6-(5-phosphoribosylamino)uracil reductase RibD [Candidatus Acetothermia bacterium]
MKEEFMEMAIDLACHGEGYVNPNPLVGAVVVAEGKVIGRGYHKRFGAPHAEIVALDEAGTQARGADLYVTLEPCCHYGKQPPCTERIIAAGIAHVIIACRDPNPIVNGRGIAHLRDSGLEITVGLLAEKAERLNEIFFTYITTGIPFVHLKLAMSLDGKIATRTGDSQWITNEESRIAAHRLRRKYSALLVGVNTVITDDPRLTTRHVPGRNPLRIILDGKGRIPVTARIFTEPGRTIVVTATMPHETEQRIQAQGGEVWRIMEHEDKVDLRQLLHRLGREGIDGLLIEGGGTTAASFLEAGLIDKVTFFFAPLIIGGAAAVPAVGGQGIAEIARAIRLSDIKTERINDDLIYTGYIK